MTIKDKKKKDNAEKKKAEKHKAEKDKAENEVAASKATSKGTWTQYYSKNCYNDHCATKLGGTLGKMSADACKKRCMLGLQDQAGRDCIQMWQGACHLRKQCVIDKCDNVGSHGQAYIYKLVVKPTGKAHGDSHVFKKNPSPTTGYNKVGSGGKKLFSVGPNCEVTKGITACVHVDKCNGDSKCNGFVWWTNFGCRTYTSCKTVVGGHHGNNHVF